MQPGKSAGITACVLIVILLIAAILPPVSTGRAAAKAAVTFYGVVHDATTRAPIAGATVTINKVSALTDRVGHYMITLSSIGTSFHITGNAAGYLPVSLSFRTSTPRGRWQFDFAGRFGLKAFASLTAVITGVVLDAQTRRGISNATVVGPGKPALTDRAGHYFLTTHAAPRFELNASALGYRPGPSFEVLSRGRGPVYGRLTVNFSGAWGLQSVFYSKSGATLTPMHQLLTSTTHTVAIAGAGRQPIGGMAVTYPNGDATLLPFAQHGSHFSGTLALDHGRGIYQLEVNARSGFALFTVPLYAGVPYTMPPDSPTYPPDKPTSTVAQLVGQLHTLLDALRAPYHRAPLRLLTQLNNAAQAHSRDVIAYGYYTSHPHIGSDGSTPALRIARAGVHARYVTEDVALNPSIRGALQEFLASPSHRAVLLSARVTEVGIGIARRTDGQLLVTIDLITP